MGGSNSNQLKYGVYTTGENVNYFSGNVGVGSTTPEIKVNIGLTNPTSSLKVVKISGTNPAESVATLALEGATNTFNYEVGVIDFLNKTNAGYNMARITGNRASSGGLADGTLKFYTSKSNSLLARMIIDENGNVGIGCTAPNQKLYVSGNIYATGTVLGSQAACSSDLRWKKDFENLSGSLNSILKLQGLYYYWKKDEFPEKEFSTKREIGLIAQEVEKIYPELIFTDEKGYKYLDYSHLTPVLVEAIKEQQAIIENLREELNTKDSQYQKQFEELKAEMQEMNSKLGFENKAKK